MRVSNQKMLSKAQDVLYRLSLRQAMTHSAVFSGSRLSRAEVGIRGGAVMKVVDVQTRFHLRLATPADLSFTREITCRNMLRYYISYDLLWQDEAFDIAWAGRENWMIECDGRPVGYFSLSRDARALYIRELQVCEGFQGHGAGSWALDQVVAMAHLERRPALRLTVFKNNPAQDLYRRKGMIVQGEDECFLRMQLEFSTCVL